MWRNTTTASSASREWVHIIRSLLCRHAAIGDGCMRFVCKSTLCSPATISSVCCASSKRINTCVRYANGEFTCRTEWRCGSSSQMRTTRICWYPIHARLSHVYAHVAENFQQKSVAVLGFCGNVSIVALRRHICTAPNGNRESSNAMIVDLHPRCNLRNKL